MLDSAALAVRPGGSVLYSVCTWTRAETDEVVAAAAARLPQLRQAPLGGPFGDATTRQLWPHTDGTDGIFLALLHQGRPSWPLWLAGQVPI